MTRVKYVLDYIGGSMSEVCRAGSMHAAAVPGSGARMRSRGPYVRFSLVLGPDLLGYFVHT